MDYKQTDVAGTSWHRFNVIVISNPYLNPPYVTCNEQEVIQISPDKYITQDAGSVGFDFSPSEQFELLNPVTNEPLGTMVSGMDVYTLVYSYVMHEAKKRDEASV